MKARSALVALLLVLILTPFGAGTADATQGPVEVRLLPVAQLVDDGSMVVPVTVRCDPVGDVLEAMGFAEQDDAFAEGHFSNVICDGRRRVERMHFTPFDEAAFEPGRANVSAFILILVDEASGDTVAGGDSRSVRVVRSAHPR